MAQPSEETWQRYRTIYASLYDQDQVRLTATAFLSGLTVAAFAALATAPGIKADVALLAAAVFLASASLFFLLTAYNAYQGLGRLHSLNPDLAQALREGRGARPSDIGADDADRLEDAYTIHHAASSPISGGLGLLVLAILSIALWIHPVVVVLTILTGLYIAWRSREGLRVYLRHTPGIHRLRP
jgi:hypothetical protein